MLRLLFSEHFSRKMRLCSAITHFVAQVFTTKIKYIFSLINGRKERYFYKVITGRFNSQLGPSYRNKSDEPNFRALSSLNLLYLHRGRVQNSFRMYEQNPIHCCTSTSFKLIITIICRLTRLFIH